MSQNSFDITLIYAEKRQIKKRGAWFKILEIKMQ